MFHSHFKNSLYKKWLLLSIITPFIYFLLGLFNFLSRSDLAYPDISLLLSQIKISAFIFILSLSSLIFYISVNNQYKYLFNITFYSQLAGITLITFHYIFLYSKQELIELQIPIFNNFVFLLGFGIFTTVVLINSILATMLLKPKMDIAISIYCLSLLILLTFISFTLSYNIIPNGIDLENFYKYLFQQGSTLLNFFYIQLIVISCITILRSNSTINILSLTNIVASLPLIFVYFFYSIYNSSLTQFTISYTEYSNTFLSLLIILYCLTQGQSKLKAYLFVSPLLINILTKTPFFPIQNKLDTVLYFMLITALYLKHLLDDKFYEHF